MESEAEENFVDVPERPTEVLELPIRVTTERPGNDPQSWADRVAGESHSEQPARSVYPSHLRSEVDSFDGVLPNTTLGELSSTEQLRLFRLNGLPDRPCSARFTLPDNTIDSKTILDKIVSIGIQRKHVKCIQRFRTGQVDVTFCRKSDRDLFLSKMVLVFQHHSVRARPPFESGIFVTVRDAPWEMTDELIATRLEENGTVHSIRRAYNQSLLPEKVFDGRRVLRMTVEKDIPCFLKFGPLLLRIFYPRQPKACWKCASLDHIGRECPSDFCFNCHHSGHQAHQCKERIRCSLCKSYHHLAIDCPGNWGRRTLAQRTPRREEAVVEKPPLRSEDEQDMDNPDESSEEHTETSESSSEVLSDDTVHEVDEEASIAEVTDDIELFTSLESDTDPLHHQRKRGAAKEPHVKKKSRTEEKPP